MTIKDRLLKFLSYLEVGQTKFEEKVGLSRGLVNNIKGNISTGTLNKISAAHPELNVNWLLSGEGEMLNDGHGISMTDISQKQESDVEYIPLLPVSAQGGTLNDFIVSVKGNDCEKIVSPIKGADWAISVSGDSMAPEYPSGSQVLIKKINERAFIDWGKVYVLDTCNGVVIKRLFPANDDSEKIECRSINPDYPSFEVSFSDIYGIYRVMLCMSVK